MKFTDSFLLFFLQEVTVELLVQSLRQHVDATGIIVEGYPRTMAQVNEFDKRVRKTANETTHNFPEHSQ